MGPKLIFDIMSYRPRRERKRTDMLQRGKYLGYELEIRHNVNGPKKYCVPGREPDTADSLENDGLIKQKTAYEIMPSLVGSEMCIRDRTSTQPPRRQCCRLASYWPICCSNSTNQRRHWSSTGRC